MLVTSSNVWLVEAERPEEALSAEPISESWPLSGIDKTCWGRCPIRRRGAGTDPGPLAPSCLVSCVRNTLEPSAGFGLPSQTA